MLLYLELIFHQYHKIYLSLWLVLPLTFRSSKKRICLQVLLDKLKW